MKHYFDVDVAGKYGIEAAIIIEQIAYWIRHNEQNGTNLKEGKHWMYNSIPAFKKQHPYMSERKIRRVLKDLEKQGVISIGNYNKKGFDRTKWYTIEIPMKHNGDVVVDSCGQNGHIEPDKMATCSIRSGQMDADKMAVPIPLEETLEENINNVPVQIDNKKVTKREVHFQACWLLYPKKTGKTKVTAKAKDSLMEVTVDQFAKIVELEKSSASEVKYMKGGERYFNSEYWRDHCEENTPTTLGKMPAKVSELTQEHFDLIVECNGVHARFARLWGLNKDDLSYPIKNYLTEYRYATQMGEKWEWTQKK